MTIKRLILALLYRVAVWVKTRHFFYSLGVLFGLWKFLDIAANVVTRDEITYYDRIIVQMLNIVAVPAVTQGLLWITYLGGEYLGIIYAITLIVMLALKRWAEALMLTLATGGSLLLVNVIKEALGRERPVLNAPVHLETGFSFPSGHSTVSLCFYGALLYFIMSGHKPVVVKLVSLLLIAGLILGIGLSRVYLGVHYPSDVLAGFCLGLFWVSLCAWGYQWIQTRRLNVHL